MSTRSEPTVYLVQWPDGIVKIGFSQAKRWTAFVFRGATVLHLERFESVSVGYDAEGAFHDLVHRERIGIHAFNSREEAVPYLGSRGAGWRECYRMTNDMAQRLRTALDGMAEEMAR